jgi:hypothetical protein
MALACATVMWSSHKKYGTAFGSRSVELVGGSISQVYPRVVAMSAHEELVAVSRSARHGAKRGGVRSLGALLEERARFRLEKIEGE